MHFLNHLLIRVDSFLEFFDFLKLSAELSRIGASPLQPSIPQELCELGLNSFFYGLLFNTFATYVFSTALFSM